MQNRIPDDPQAQTQHSRCGRKEENYKTFATESVEQDLSNFIVPLRLDYFMMQITSTIILQV